MSKELTADGAATYVNPVYPHSFPDPFVLKFRGEYFAYCTDLAPDGNVFGVLYSRDLVNWEPLGGAMSPLPDSAPFYWAPEVTNHNGKFYLYYSAGNETLMDIRVAVSDRPDGGFVDAGRRLTNEDFAIDAHVFIDDDGAKYLFYATDFLEHTHVGTGTVFDKMLDWFTLERKPRIVTRAKYDWQVYDPVRKEKGGVRWHTVEGPAVLKRKGIYYEMFSGGNWKNTTYGVSFAIADSFDRDEEWLQFSDGDAVLPILRTIPDLIVGPGHNSVVRGPNNRELYCIYHRWTDNGRVLCIDRMDFVGRRLFVNGATYTPQPAPFPPAASGFADGWQMSGKWLLNEDTAASTAAGSSELSHPVPESFLCEFSFRCMDTDGTDSSVGFVLRTGGGQLRFSLFPKDEVIRLSGRDNREYSLTADFDPSAFHLFRIEADGQHVKVTLNAADLIYHSRLPEPVTELSLFSVDARTEFSGFALTDSFEELFDRGDEPLDAGLWQTTGDAEVRIEDGEHLLSANDNVSVLARRRSFDDFEFAVNVRLAGRTGDTPEFGIALLEESGSAEFRLVLDISGKVVMQSAGQSTVFDLPDGVGIGYFRQYRLVKKNRSIAVYLEDLKLAELPFPANGLRPAVFCRGCTVALDMFRVTAI